MTDRPMFGYAATAILVIALLYFAQSIFVPLAFSLFVIVGLADTGDPPEMVAEAGGIARDAERHDTPDRGCRVVDRVGIRRSWATWLFLNAGRFQIIYNDWTSWLEGHGIAIVSPIMDRFDVAWLLGFAQNIAGRLNSLAGFSVLVVILVMLGLLEGRGVQFETAAAGCATLWRKRSWRRTARSAKNCAASWSYAALPAC